MPPSSAQTATKKHVILFLAANPHDTGRVALDREARSIHVELKRSGYRDRFDFVTRWAAEPLDLLRELRELRPTIVHFSGHGAGQVGPAERPGGRHVFVAGAPPRSATSGLVFEGANGRIQVVSPEAIAHAFGACGTHVRLVVLNACYSAPIAEALCAHVDCVVGMSGAIHDEAARSFAIGFYGGLGEHESISAAFEQGKVAIDLDGMPDAHRPQLHTRNGFDAAQLILAAAPQSGLVELRCPYPGMRPFAADDADSFHGRDDEIAELIGRLRAGEREVFVIGPSGSGKSSLVTAGVLPRLARGVSGLGPFVVRELRPGEQPATRLGQALELPAGEPLVVADRVVALLAHRGPGASILIVIDQLEELFTLASAAERMAFLDALRALRGERRSTVVFTLRADFYGLLMESTLWAERRSQLSRVEVGPLRGEALREAIVAPARAVGVTVEPELIERLMADAASEPGILPLVQETLVQLWDARIDQTLTLAGYEALGDGERSGLAVALARRADATLRQLNTAQTAIARRILLRLISFGEGRSDTRRQQPRAQLRAAGDDEVDFAFVLQTMVDHRLLTVDEEVAGEPGVDLAHEVMISAWPTLSDWIRAHRADEQRRRQLEVAADLWVELGRGRGGLLDAIELVEAERWQQSESAVQLGQSAQVEALIASSRAAHTQQRRRRRLIGGAMSLLGVVAVAIAAAALAARDQASEARRLASYAQEQRLRAEASDRKNRELVATSYAETGRQLVLEHRFQEAIPYLLAAHPGGTHRAPPPLGMMFGEAMHHLPLIRPLEHQAAVVSAAFSPDGARVVTASEDHTARIWDGASGKPLTRPLEHHAEVVTAAFSPDGTRVVTASRDHTARVWDAATGKPITSSLEHQAAVWSAAFSPDGTRVVTASLDQTARVWDVATGKPVTRPLEHQAAVWSAVFSPEGTRVVTASGDRTARVWDAATGSPLTDPLIHQAPVQSAAFSPDGTRVVTASRDQTARVWDATTGELLTRLRGHRAAVQRVAFNAEGTRVVTASEDHTARVWDAVTGKPLTSPLEHHGAVWSIAFSPDGTRVATASEDHTAQVWDAVTGEPLTSALEHQADVGSATFSPDGTHVVTASADHTARIWDAAGGRPRTRPLEHQAEVVSVAFSPDGTRVVTASWDKTARVWDAATGKPITSSLEHQAAVWSAAFSPDGRHVVTTSRDATVRVWDAVTGILLSSLEHRAEVWSAAFSPDGTRVVTASGDKIAHVWDAATGRPLTRLEHRAEVRSAMFSPDGVRVVTASLDKTARVWDATTGELLARLEHQAAVLSAAFSPDGMRVVTTSGDETVRVWDARTGKPLTSLFEHGAAVWSIRGAIWNAAFSSDGMRVVIVSSDGTAQICDAVTGKPLTSPLEHHAEVESVAFSPDGTRVLTASDDHTARVWDTVTGKPLTNPLKHMGRVVSAAFSPDGTRVVTASWDKTARVWDLPIDTGTLEQWSAIAERCPFVLQGGVLLRRSSSRTDPKPWN